MDNNTCCNICCNGYTKVSRKKICCSQCDFASCAVCVKKYILTQYTRDAVCMGCKSTFDDEFLEENFSKTFIFNDLRKHQASVLFDYEKSRLPETALSLEMQQDCKKGDKAPKRQIIRKCVAENCNGFLGSNYKCGTCHTVVCSACHVVKKKDDHECNPDDIESVKLIAKDSKPCPRCVSLIFKVDGCDLMYCTLCNVSFSWKSGEEVFPTYNHNPHYLEELRAKNKGGVIPRAVGDVNIPFMNINDFDVTMDPRIRELTRSINRSLGHMLDYNILRYDENFMTDHQHLRVQFIRNEITEAVWKRELTKRDKQRRFGKEHKKVASDTLNAAINILNEMKQGRGDQETIVACIDNLSILFYIFNESVKKLFVKYGYKLRHWEYLMNIDTWIMGYWYY